MTFWIGRGTLGGFEASADPSPFKSFGSIGNVEFAIYP
jgi:hypothetical protein